MQPGYTSQTAIKKVLATPPGTRAVLPREAYPLLVTFTNIADPNTVMRVDPDDLAATFGLGVSLKRITLETTDSEVTSKAAKALPWICSLLEKRARLNGKTGPISDNELSNNLGAGHFRTEKCT
ncbi:hypothetical protein [Mesorhizobium sp. ZC-5]|uniref:hypothetical protein n=1 Tax=Mesorhizobium sp. ZC-5 TaxID=2986066 RepID=UPI0021E96BCD|nr:hypothetical protein [Mesorhizobium sp. ZC-5]MCV3238603.1 hypothetical protein [Mesorhizobium sp. ZC-5]